MRAAEEIVASQIDSCCDTEGLATLIDRAADIPALEARVCKHGWRGAPSEPICDRCPSCGNQTLFIGSGGYLTCSWLPCKQPGVGREIEQLKARVAELERAVRNEREACAREAEKYAHGFFIANQLRARGQR